MPPRATPNPSRGGAGRAGGGRGGGPRGGGPAIVGGGSVGGALPGAQITTVRSIFCVIILGISYIWRSSDWCQEAWLWHFG